MVDVGLVLAVPGSRLDRESLPAWLDGAVEAGFDSVWTLENLLADTVEPLVLLATAAAGAPSLGIGTSVVLAPLREPILLAKQLASLDRLAGPGRLKVGLATGSRAEDYEATGQDFSRRARRLEDVVDVLRMVWSGKAVDLDGATGRFRTPGPVGPEPATPGGPPILLGGKAPPALRRAVARGDGYLASATAGPAANAAVVAKVRALLDQAGRDASSFTLASNAFVAVDDRREDALARSEATFRSRYGDRMPFAVEDVVIAGPADTCAEALAELAGAGYGRLNLVPVIPEPEQVALLAPVVDALGRC